MTEKSELGRAKVGEVKPIYKFGLGRKSGHGKGSMTRQEDDFDKGEALLG